MKIIHNPNNNWEEEAMAMGIDVEWVRGMVASQILLDRVQTREKADRVARYETIEEIARELVRMRPRNESDIHRGYNECIDDFAFYLGSLSTPNKQ